MSSITRTVPASLTRIRAVLLAVCLPLLLVNTSVSAKPKRTALHTNGKMTAKATHATKIHGAIPTAPIRYSDAGVDAQLANVFEHIEQNRIDAALRQIDVITQTYPNFRLAHLIRGDLLLARGRQIKTLGNITNAPPDKLNDLRAEAIARIKAYREKPAENTVPRYLLQMQANQRHAVIVDAQRSRLYLYQNDNGTPRFVADYYITHGKSGTDKMREGDKKTPIGVYHVTGSLPRAQLGDFYGPGAFPISYPNEWDKRQGRNGHGIWLHGTPSDTYSRPPKASDGCVVLTNQDLNALSRTLQIGLTPVIISNQVEWLSLDDWQAERSALNQAIEQWRADWESLNVERYLSHYSKKFSSDSQDISDWSAHKRRVANGKTFIKVDVDNLSVFRNPGKDDVVIVTFEQDYRSNNLNNAMKKQQFWQKEQGHWKIIYEGAA